MMNSSTRYRIRLPWDAAQRLDMARFMGEPPTAEFIRDEFGASTYEVTPETLQRLVEQTEAAGDMHEVLDHLRLVQRIHPSVDVDYVLDNMHSDYEEGWCIACGFEQQDVPRLQRDGWCGGCGKNKMWGSFALCELLTGIPAPRPDA